MWVARLKKDVGHKKRWATKIWTREARHESGRERGLANRDGGLQLTLAMNVCMPGARATPPSLQRVPADPMRRMLEVLPPIVRFRSERRRQQRQTPKCQSSGLSYFECATFLLAKFQCLLVSFLR